MSELKLVPFPTVPSPAKKQKPKPADTKKPSRVCVSLTIGTNPETGRLIRKYFYGKTKKAAEQKKKLWEAEQMRVQIEEKERMDQGASQTDREQLLARWVDKWLIAYNTTGGFSTSYSTELGGEDLKSALGTMRLCDIRQIDVQQYASSMSDKSESHVTKRKATTRAIFRAALANMLIKVDPCEGVKWLHRSKSVANIIGADADSWAHSAISSHRYLEPWEISLIIKHAPVYRVGLWVMLMLFAGLRRGEALGLRWDDIDFAAGAIHVRRAVHFENNTPVIGPPKTVESIRTVPILPPLRDMFDRIPMPPRSPYLCTMLNSQIVTSSGFTRAWCTYLNTMSNILNSDTAEPIAQGRRSDKDKQKYKDTPRRRFAIRAHDLRHTYASILYDADVDMLTAQKLLGHSTPDMTMRIYTHLSAKKKSVSVDKLAEYTANLIKT